MHSLNNPIHSIASHYEGVMLEDAVDVESLQENRKKNSHDMFYVLLELWK